MIEFVMENFSVTTAEDERNYFTNQPEPNIHPSPNVVVRPGVYRIIDGELYRINPGSPPIAELVKNNAENLASI